MEFDLVDLDDSVFQIHEEIFTDERQLFQLHNHFDHVMRSNPTARFDGVFKGRLSADLRQRKTNWEDFWRTNLSETGGKNLSVQFLVADPNNPYVMESSATTLQRNRTSFFKTLHREESLQNPTPNCCSEILRIHGPKRAVKHFYEALESKCIFIPKSTKSADLDSVTNCKRRNFNDRQSILQGDDPVTVCALIEQSMKSKTYIVKDNDDANSNSCDCHQCHINRHVEAVNLEPLNLKADGDGENCAVYVTDIVEECGKFLYITPNFALSHLCHANMLTDLDSFYDGVSFPYVYVGGLHSHFALHIEDMSLPSFNYLHMGHPKLWIVVSPTEIQKLSILLSNYGLRNLHRVCIFKLSHKNSVIFPQLLLEKGIKFKIIIQEPGDFIFLAPNAAHTGGNLGLNVAEACNVGTHDWLPYGSVSSTENCNCLENKVHMDITTLMKIHRKDLLQFHERRSMATNFNDIFFKRTIIGGSGTRDSASSDLAAGILPAPFPGTSRKKKDETNKKMDRIACPVEDCFKTYAKPLKKLTLLTHLQQEHPSLYKKKKILQAVEKLFPKTS